MHKNESNVDREIRIERMKRELEELSGGSMVSGSFEEVSPELGEIFLERVCEFEKTPWETNSDRLVRHGIELIPPAELDDAHLSAKLDEVMRALATIRCFCTTQIT